MSISRRALYAFGEPLGDCATTRKPGGIVCGGGDSSTTGATTSTTNTDKRVAVQDGVGISGEGNTIVYSNNSSDAVVAMTNAGQKIITESGGAVVELAKLQTNANTAAWNTTVTTGAGLVDKLIDKVSDGFKLSEKVVSSFTPTENKNADIGKYAMIAAAVVAGAVLLKAQK